VGKSLASLSFVLRLQVVYVIKDLTSVSDALSECDLLICIVAESMVR